MCQWAKFWPVWYQKYDLTTSKHKPMKLVASICLIIIKVKWAPFSSITACIFVPLKIVAGNTQFNTQALLHTSHKSKINYNSSHWSTEKRKMMQVDSYSLKCWLNSLKTKHKSLICGFQYYRCGLSLDINVHICQLCVQGKCSAEHYICIIRTDTWLHSVHGIAVPISRSPQCSWWHLVLAETHPAQWVTLRNI